MKKSVLFFCSILLAFLAVGNVQAIPLQDLFDGATFTVHDKLFADWELFELTSDFEVDLGAIEIIPLYDDPLNPGFQFVSNGQLDVLGPGRIDLEFGFSVSTLSGEPLIKDNSLDLLPTVVTCRDSGACEKSLNINESVFDPDYNLLAYKELYWKQDDIGASDTQFSDWAEFSPQEKILVWDFIDVESFHEGSNLELTGFEQRFSQVASIPDASTLFLLGSACLVGFSGLRRKFKK